MSRSTAEHLGAGVSTPSNDSLSQRIWNIHWEDHFPMKIGTDDIIASASNYEGFKEFVAKHPSLIYQNEKNTNFVDLAKPEFRDRYYETGGDFFRFTEADTTIGFFIGNATDWGTYYFRYATLLPQYRGKQIYQQFLVVLMDLLAKYGVERVEGDIPPSHFGHIYVLNKLKFMISGYTVSERWGAFIRFTKLLRNESDQAFVKQFCIVQGKTGRKKSA